MADRGFELKDLQRILQAGAGADQGVDLGGGTVLDTTFDDLGYDSIALLETAGRISREYGVTFDDDALVEATTPRRLIDLVNAS
jgi:act minimal PKS acyl carrier protein